MDRKPPIRGCTLINAPTFQRQDSSFGWALGGGFGLGCLTGKANIQLDSGCDTVNLARAVFYTKTFAGWWESAFVTTLE